MRIRNTFLSLALVTAAVQTLSANNAHLVEATQKAHGLESWWGKEVVQADVQIIFHGNLAVDGTFTFEAHGPRSRYDRADGTSIIFDGTTAWVSPASAVAPKGRFHVLTWPWFIMAPFKMQGEGITLSEHSVREVDGVPYETLLQTFAGDMGDAPDDWYRFFIDPASKRIEAMSYIVTYGKDAAEANKQPSIIRYFDYSDAGGPLISTRYEFWLWDPQARAYVGDAPKATGAVSKIRYPKRSEVDFTVPEDARELKLPGE